jgi:hypothetical protein
MATIQEVLADLENVKGDKKVLMQKYSQEQQAIINKYGGNFSDVPPDNTGEYAELQNRIFILNRMV